MFSASVCVCVFSSAHTCDCMIQKFITTQFFQTYLQHVAQSVFIFGFVCPIISLIFLILLRLLMHIYLLLCILVLIICLSHTLVLFPSHIKACLGQKSNYA